MVTPERVISVVALYLLAILVLLVYSAAMPKDNTTARVLLFILDTSPNLKSVKKKRVFTKES